jgi:hypothetical protein
MAGTTGLEPATSAVTGQRSNQLSYVPTLNTPNAIFCFDNMNECIRNQARCEPAPDAFCSLIAMNP